jgi:pimeloyl-ACP methyl ester carboxylesterase
VGEPTAFRVEFGDAAIADLRRRLAQTRWPEPATVDGWTQGVPLPYLRDLCRYWAADYNFAQAVERINRFPQFHLVIDGLAIHYVHVRSPRRDAIPVVLTHGWPGSFVEFLDIIELLTDPDDDAPAFDVVIPSLPGYGFSERPSSAGWDVERTAQAWDELMRRLGYERYGAQGGDWGAFVTTTLARRFPDRVIGIHLNLPAIDLAGIGTSATTPEEQAALEVIAQHRRVGAGYSALQSTRPQTLGYALADSPAGQCAWIVEKFWAWTDCDGEPERAVQRDKILDNVSVYWFSNTATSAARMYWESRRSLDMAPLDTPTGVSVFPKDISPLSRRWCERRYRDLRWYNRLEHGGHFASLEQPDAFVGEVRSFFGLVRPEPVRVGSLP